MIMLIMTAGMLLIILTLGLPSNVLTILHCFDMCMGLCLFAEAIFTAVRRFSDEGTACGVNEASILDEQDERISFADNASTLKTLMIM